ncbi:alpha-mannosidase [Leptolyngbya boryana CZ1]|uniref:Alpha-mannosidase n=1 Tax=Leptolyngbya boryana CZ1 TaxID=3060204 RepID=A0AA96WRP5_LEPBY|nr:alpha-mannosidase [Leptolyngbya boryana]WNZ44487.1 alpha-mannosidase [Leptolyngbya boryana CZ1]
MVEFVTSFIERLRNLVQADAIEHWLVCETDCTIADLSTQSFTKLELNEKRYLVWEKGRKVRWFYQEFSVPEDLAGYPLEGLTLRLALTWWAELAEVFVNGQKVQEGDLFDHSCRIVLSSATVLGEKIAVAIRLVSPGHDIGGLMRSRLIYESNYDEIDPGFVADELEVIQSYVEAFELDKLEFELDWQVSNRSQFHQSLAALRNSLLPFSTQIKQHTIYLLGHAHLDMAWLWDVEETWRAAERTFVSVLNLQKDFPELTFCHTTPALFEWVEQNRPELFAQIQAQVKAGTWEIVGGMWVEPEMNLINAESIARHLLYGQRYCQEKFGEICRVAWLPDTFGFNWQTPQFLKLAGIDYFVTQKLRWNDTTRFPYEWFNWQAPDGSQVKSLMSSPIGEGIDPIKMAQFAWDWVKKTGQPHALWLFGVGDHGGGPTRDMLEIAERWKRSPFFPKLEFTTALKYLESLEAPKDTWNDELYLEFHRGCYTTHGDQKSFNRKCESLLYQAELWASIVSALTGENYPKSNLETARKIALFNQFHDILPGTSINQVFRDANLEWIESIDSAMDVRYKSWEAIAKQIKLPLPPHPQAEAFVIFNPSNWERAATCRISAHNRSNFKHKNWQVFDSSGQLIEQQFLTSSITPTVICQVNHIPAAGYRCIWLCPTESSKNVSFLPEPAPFVLENQYLKVEIDSESGELASIFDKVHQREILRGNGNQLQAFRDSGQYWDAWNIDPAYQNYPLPSAKVLQIYRVENQDHEIGFYVEQSLETSPFDNSIFHHRYSLEEGSPILKITTSIDWQERHLLVKTAFPLNVESDTATYEISAGVIERTNRPQTEAEKAKWEVPALGWVTLGNENYGVSLLSEYKHGYDCQVDQIRLTLLRGSEFPDPKADLGMQTFTYAIYPHEGTWQQAKTVQKASELLHPVRMIPFFQVFKTYDYSTENGTLPPVHSFLDLGADNLMLSSLKQSEDNLDEYILRCYECHGEPAELNLKGDFEIIEPVDLLERPIALPNKIEPWQIRTYKLKKRASFDTL